MKTIIELMTALSAVESFADGTELCVKSGITGAKDVYLAWGKERGQSLKFLNEEWKVLEEELRPAKRAGANGFAAMYYDWLAGESRTEQEARDLIMGSESQNVRNHLTHYLNIWALAETVRRGEKVVRTISAGKASPKPNGGASAKAQAKDTWEYNDADPFADERSAWENLKRETAKAKPRKSRIHPDKVSKLEDADLSAAYTKAFQVYGK